MAASIAKGKTIIENAAREPEINDLAFALNKMGAKINVKKNGIIKIDGVNSLTQATHKIMSDRIVAGTFVIAAVMLNKKFEVQSYKFDKDFALLDSLEYTGTQTNIGKSLETINAIHKDDQAAVVLLSDGNQTIGNSYLYQSKFLSQAVFPVVIGDTTPYVDLKIQQLNVNKYTFLGNTFPVEIFVNYNGSRSIQSNLKIYSGASLLFDNCLLYTSPSPRD